MLAAFMPRHRVHVVVVAIALIVAIAWALAELIGPARRTGEQQMLALASTVAARIALARGDRALARAYIVEFEADQNKVDPFIVLSLIANESDFNACAVSRVGKDLGLMQLRTTGAGRHGQFHQALAVPQDRERACLIRAAGQVGDAVVARRR